jgi:hypothetical protein
MTCLHARFRSEGLKVKCCLWDQCVGGRVILFWILKKKGVRMWTRFIWPRIESSGRRLWIFNFNKRTFFFSFIYGISWLVCVNIGFSWCPWGCKRSPMFTTCSILEFILSEIFSEVSSHAVHRNVASDNFHSHQEHWTRRHRSEGLRGTQQ